MDTRTAYLAQPNQAPGAGQQPANLRGEERPIPDTIDFVYDHDIEGDLAALDNVKSPGDYTRIDGDHETADNEVMEVTRIEMIPPTNADGSLQPLRHLQLWDGENAYPNIRFREFMMGFFGQDFSLSTPPLGAPVLAGNNPADDPIGTATPKFGRNTPVTPRVNNDGTAITDSFRVRFHVWRWQGDDAELEDYINDTFNRTAFPQTISMSNPFTGVSDQFERGQPVQIRRGADGGALGQFTRLTGGVDQETPKVWPWATWSENNNQTTTNDWYEFTTVNDRVDEPWKRLQFSLTDGERAVFFTHAAVNQPDHLEKARFELAERDEQPELQTAANSAHELPILRPLDGTSRDNYSPGQIPRNLSERLGQPQVIWDDGGGLQVMDDGTAVAAQGILVGVRGWRLTLES